MIVTDLRLSRHQSDIEFSARLIPERFPFLPERIWWRFPPSYGEYLRLSGNPLLPALLLPCMMRHEQLVIEAPVSARLLGAVPAIQALYRSWLAQAAEIEVVAPTEAAAHPPGAGTGCFFSGGVDSFYSLLKNGEADKEDERLTHLIFIAGFDIKLKKRELLGRMRALLQQTADAVAKQYLEVSTNAKTIGDRAIDWRFYFGPVLASVGLALAPLLKTVIIPSSFAWHQLHPDGSHPDLDVLWSTERTAFVHDGCEATRVEKVVGRVAHSDLALAHLRVCWRTRDLIYNCGVCEKCLRTMISLYIGTGRTEFPTFPRPLLARDVARIELPKGSILRYFARENLDMLKDRDGFGAELREALQIVLNQQP